MGKQCDYAESFSLIKGRLRKYVADIFRLDPSLKDRFNLPQDADTSGLDEFITPNFGLGKEGNTLIINFKYDIPSSVAYKVYEDLDGAVTEYSDKLSKKYPGLETLLDIEHKSDANIQKKLITRKGAYGGYEELFLIRYRHSTAFPDGRLEVTIKPPFIKNGVEDAMALLEDIIEKVLFNSETVREVIFNRTFAKKEEEEATKAQCQKPGKDDRNPSSLYS